MHLFYDAGLEDIGLWIRHVVIPSVAALSIRAHFLNHDLPSHSEFVLSRVYFLLHALKISQGGNGHVF
jgi:hypothetical protein